EPPHVSHERRTPESGLHHPEPIPALIAAISGHTDGSYRLDKSLRQGTFSLNAGDSVRGASLPVFDRLT
ncbi:TPA: hypothetical protein QDA69_006134, partial [Burkholderia territorii]